MSIRPPVPADAPSVSAIEAIWRFVEVGRGMAPAIGVWGLALFVGIALASLFPMQLPGWTVEHGPVETLTVVGYGLACAIAVYLWPRLGAVAGLVALLAVLLALREVDAHAAFTRFGIFSSRLYFRPDVPWGEKLGAGATVLALAGLLIWAGRAAWPRLVAEGGRVGLTLGSLFLFAGVLKQLDALPRQLRRLGVPLDPDALALSRAVEEIGEAFLPILLVLVLLQALPQRTRSQG